MEVPKLSPTDDFFLGLPFPHKIIITCPSKQRLPVLSKGHICWEVGPVLPSPRTAIKPSFPAKKIHDECHTKTRTIRTCQTGTCTPRLYGSSAANLSYLALAAVTTWGQTSNLWTSRRWRLEHSCSLIGKLLFLSHFFTKDLLGKWTEHFSNFRVT